MRQYGSQPVSKWLCEQGTGLVPRIFRGKRFFQRYKKRLFQKI